MGCGASAAKAPAAAPAAPKEVPGAQDGKDVRSAWGVVDAKPEAVASDTAVEAVEFLGDGVEQLQLGAEDLSPTQVARPPPEELPAMPGAVSPIPAKPAPEKVRRVGELRESGRR